MPNLSAVQRLMYEEIKKDHPTLTEDEFSAFQPSDIQDLIHASPEKWLTEHMGSQSDKTTNATFVEHGAKVLNAPADFGRGVARAPSLIAHAITHPVESAGGMNDMAFNALFSPVQGTNEAGRSVGARGGVPIRPGGGMVTEQTPGSITPETADQAQRNLLAATMMGQGPVGAMAGGALSNLENPAQGAGEMLGMYGTGNALAKTVVAPAVETAQRGVRFVKELSPKNQMNAMIRGAAEHQAGGPNLGRATMGKASGLGFDKTDVLRGVNISPEMASVGDFVLQNNPAERARVEAELGQQSADVQPRLAYDLSKEVGGRYNTGERVKELTQERSAFGQSPEGYGGMKPKPTYEAAAHADIEPFFSQPITQDALRSAERTGLIGTTVDPVAVAREQFQQEVAQAQHAQGLWDSKAAQLGASGKQMPGELYGGAKSAKSQAIVEQTLGPRPEVPTAPPVPSPEMMHHVLKRLDKAVTDGFQAGGAQADIAARLQPVADHLRQFLHDHVEGFTQANQGWADRSGLIEAHQKLPTSPEGVLSAEDAWKLKDTDALEKQMAALSRKPIPKPGTIVDFGSKSQLNEFQDAMASHLRTAIENGDLKPEQLTMDALKGDKALYDKVRSAFERERDFRNFTARAKIETIGKNYTAPGASTKPPIATQPWFSKYLPAKILYKMGGKKYMNLMSEAGVPELFTPGHAPQFRPRSPITGMSDASQKMAALAAMLSAQRGDSTP